MKTCSKCQESKPLDEYYKDNRQQDGKYSACKACHNTFQFPRITKRVKESPTPELVARKFYMTISNRCGYSNHYKDVQNLLTIDTLTHYVNQNWTSYLEQHKTWKVNGFRRKYAPSIDRVDSAGDYKIENIRIVPNHVNCGKANLGRKQTEEHIRKRSDALKIYQANKH